MKKILSLDLGITSLGYAVLQEIDDNRYEVLFLDPSKSQLVIMKL